VAGGIDVPLHLGSASTFTLGGFGGHEGRALVRATSLPSARRTVASAERPVLTDGLRMAGRRSRSPHRRRHRHMQIRPLRSAPTVQGIVSQG